MHELGIALGLIEQVEKKLKELQEPIQTLRISVKLGKQAGLSAEALRFGFNIAKKNTCVPFAELEIEEVPLRLNCSICDHVFSAESVKEACPRCAGTKFKALSGKELKLVSIEYE